MVNPPDPNLPPEQWPDDTLVAVTMWKEARGEPVMGQLAVGCVIMNRVKRVGSVAKVVLRPYQFSCWNENDPNESLNSPHLTDPGGWKRAAALAEIVINGWMYDRNGKDTVTGGATHYCTSNLWSVPADVNHPRWHDAQQILSGNTTRMCAFGSHVFAKAAW